MKICHAKELGHLVGDIPEVIHGDKPIEDLGLSLCELSGADALMVSVLDPFGGPHLPILNVGYSPPLLSYLNRDYLTCISYKDALSSSRPMRMVDFGAKFYRTPVYKTYLNPAGYQEGVTQILRTVNGRVSGLLTMSFSQKTGVDNELRECLEIAGPSLGRLADIHSSPRWLAGKLSRSSEAYIVNSDGAVSPVRDANGPYGDVDIGDELTWAAQLVARSGTGQQLMLSGYVAGEKTEWQRVKILPIDTRHLGCALVLTERSNLPFDLTRRELDVLTCVSVGFTNRQIGEVLRISPRTVGTHVEHLLEKTNRPTRSAVAWLAEQEGLRRLSLLQQLTIGSIRPDRRGIS